MITGQTFSSIAFDELCKLVCSQLLSSGSLETDREALYFAVYWQFCMVLNKKVIFPKFLETKINTYQYNLLELINVPADSYELYLQILNNNIEDRVSMEYTITTTSITKPVIDASYGDVAR